MSNQSVIFYDSSGLVVDSRAYILARISALSTIIIALEGSALLAGGTAKFEDYKIDDGQVKFEATYSTVTDIVDAIQGFETLRQYWINKCNGHKVQLRDVKNFTYPTNVRR